MEPRPVSRKINQTQLNLDPHEVFSIERLVGVESPPPLRFSYFADAFIQSNLSEFRCMSFRSGGQASSAQRGLSHRGSNPGPFGPGSQKCS